MLSRTPKMEATLKIVSLEGDLSFTPSQLSQGLVENISRVVIGKKEVVTHAVVAISPGDMFSSRMSRAWAKRSSPKRWPNR